MPLMNSYDKPGADYSTSCLITYGDYGVPSTSLWFSCGDKVARANTFLIILSHNGFQKKRKKRKENQPNPTPPLLKTEYVNRIISGCIFANFQMAF